MAYAMTKQGSLDNCVTYEFICDTIADMNAIENKYRTIGTIAVVLSGESEGLEVYIAGSNRQWNSLSAIGSSTQETGGLSIYICSQNEVSNGLPDISEPDDITVYLVPAGETSGNLYEEYIYVNDAWEKFGAASIDLSNYATLSDISGFYTKPNSGIPAADLADTYLTQHQDVSGLAPKASPVFTGSISLGRKSGSTVGDSSVAVGNNVTASGYASHAEGNGTVASNYYSHAEGNSTTASAYNSHAEGAYTTASATNAHAEGAYTSASREAAHAEGHETTASGYYSHAEGDSTTASESNAHAEGANTVASYYASHAEGQYSQATGAAAHAEGLGGTYTENNVTYTSIARGVADHVEGYQCETSASMPGNHAEGYQTHSTGGASHSEGVKATASGNASHAEGASTQATADYAHAEGSGSRATNTAAHAEGYSTTASGTNSHAEGAGAAASGNASHAEGAGTQATDNFAHAEGSGSSATGVSAHAEGAGTTASRNGAHSEGAGTTASGAQSHAEGGGTTASGSQSHAEGQNTLAVGASSHVGGKCNVSDSYSNLQEWVANTSYQVRDKVKITSTVDNNTTVKVYICKTANNDASFNSSKWQSVGDEMLYAEIIGNGLNINNRSNARALDWDGNERLMGDLYINCNPDSTGGINITSLINRIIALEEEITSLRQALNSVPENAVLDESGTPMMDESGNYIEFDTPPSGN